MFLMICDSMDEKSLVRQFGPTFGFFGYCRRKYFDTLKSFASLSLRSGADLGLSWLVVYIHGNVTLNFCNGTLWYTKITRFWSLDMFRNSVKNSNSMCVVALIMSLLFSLFPPFFNANRGREQTERENREMYGLPYLCVL